MNRHHALERVPKRLTLLFTQRQFSNLIVATLMIMKHLDIYCDCHCLTWFDCLVLQCAHVYIPFPVFVGFVVKRLMERSGTACLLRFRPPMLSIISNNKSSLHFQSHATSLDSSCNVQIRPANLPLLVPSPDEKGGELGIRLAAQPH